MKDKIALVCQRYGLEVNGGAELYCRLMAEKLATVFTVEVYTTCALDYVSWDNYYAEGTEEINGVLVHRFKTKSSRVTKKFNRIAENVFSKKNHSAQMEEDYLREQGPYCPVALAELKKKENQYKAVIFMTYLYYLTAKGLCMGFKNAFLIPTVHDEPPVYLRCYEPVFRNSKGIIWNTVEEREFAERRFPGITRKPSIMAGIGIEKPQKPWPELPKSIRNQEYITYAGRIDLSKGCGEMFDYFRRYKAQYGGNLKLVLMGKAVMEVPDDPNIIQLGFVSDEMKFAVMEQAKALVLCSKFESLSMVVLESMSVGRPVLVNGECEVLKGHCIHSNAGLYFTSYPEFSATLNYLLDHNAEYEVMRENGKKYVKENYQWDVIVDKICKLIG